MKSRMSKMIKEMVTLCKHQRDLTQVNSLLSKTYNDGLVSHDENEDLEKLIASYYKLIDWHSKNQYGIVDI